MTAIIVGNDSFSENLARKLNVDLVKFEQRTFPDDEVCPRILDDVSGDVILVNRMKLPLNPNRYFVETLLLVKTLHQSGANNIDVVMPYFVYGRQDKAFRGGEPFSAKFVLEVLQNAGMNRFFTVSSHAERDKEKLSFKNSYNINGFFAIANYLKKKKISNPIVIGPDDGAEFFVKTVADILDCEYTLFEKHRDLTSGKVEMKSTANLNGKEAIIIDDIISSGNTMIPAIELCKKNSAKNVYCYVVHLVSSAGIEKISASVKEFLSTDTIENSAGKISVVDQLADKIKVN